ncbi:MAG: coproporphyrinogen III oxidase [Clostridium sp.]|uniref:coproporphyrinogen III oxidase n=1 Tax=Clostridium sp. TaxID=1506 RepID=UPI003EE7B2D4
MKIKLNELKYRIDVYNIFNIYFPLEILEFVSEEEKAEYTVTISSSEIIVKEENLKFKKEIIGDLKWSLKKFLFEILKEKTKKNYPWGILVGIRPSKIALKLLKEGKSENEIIEIFKENYFAREDKAKLCIDVAKREEEFVESLENEISVYIGMAFCPTRCVYCSFSANPIKSNKSLVSPYLEALIKEIKELGKYIEEKGLKIKTVYFGGGTPTSVSNEEFEKVMSEIYNSFVNKESVKEFTVECGRPDSITKEKLMSMKKYKVDRISINPQTMNDKTLSLIGRGHDSKSVVQTFNLARSLGFDNINMDMIIGLPGEGVKEVQYTIKEIKKLKPDNLTIHGLSLKRGSIMHEKFLLKKGIEVKEQEEILEMFKESENLAKKLNLEPYYMYRQKNMVGNMENLGYSKKGAECIYNIQMIEERQTILALGADGVSKIIDYTNKNKLIRFANVKDVREYVKRIDEMIAKKKEILDVIYK